MYSLPYTHYSLVARCHTLLRRFVEHCSWERAVSRFKDADRVPDSSTVRRWSNGLDCFSRHFQFLQHTMSRVAHWLERGNPGAQKAAPLPWIIRLSKSCGPCAYKKSARPPSLPGNRRGVVPDWVPEAEKEHEPRCRDTQTANAPAGVPAATELDWPACGPLGVCGSMSAA